MRQPHLDASGELLDADQSADVGLLDGIRVGDALQRGQFDGLADGEHVDDGADCRRQSPDAGFDQFDQAVRHGGRATPLPVAPLQFESATGDFLLDDMPQIQDVAAGQLLETTGGVGVRRPGQARRQQRRGVLRRQRLEVEPVEIAELPEFL